MDNNQERAIKYLNRAVTRRQAIKAGGIAAVGLAFSKPLIETIMPKPAFAQYVRLIGCTPGFWQGGRGRQLWDVLNDPDWIAAGGNGTNPFEHTTKFNDYFGGTITGPTIPALDGDMMDFVGTGGTSFWPQKTARDVGAAYLNVSFGFNLGIGTGAIKSLWFDAVDQYNNSGNTNTTLLQALHTMLDDLNNNGDCLDDI